jgi:hypothetical protein
MRGRTWCLVATGALVLGAVGCANEETPDPTTTTAAAPDDTSAASGASAAGAIDLDLPRTGVYANVELTVTGATFSDVTPGSYGSDDPEPGDETHLFLDVEADYEPGFPGRSEEFEVELFSLELADETLQPDGEVDFARTWLLQPERPIDSALAFGVPAGDVTGAVLVYDDGEHEPLRLALDGAETPDPWPVQVDGGDESAVGWEGGCSEAPGTAKLLGAEWDLDGGVDLDGAAIVSAGTPRATTDTRYLRVHVEAEAGDGNCGGTVLTDEQFVIEAGDARIESINGYARELDDGESVEIVFGYLVPRDQGATLVMGWDEGSTASFPIEGP